MVVDLEYLGRESYMPLFVVLRDGHRARRRDAGEDQQGDRGRPVPPLPARTRSSPVAEIPRTLSGKKQELPIKKLLLGQPIEKVINRDAMANPACLDWYLAFARDYLARTAA